MCVASRRPIRGSPVTNPTRRLHDWSEPRLDSPWTSCANWCRTQVPTCQKAISSRPIGSERFGAQIIRVCSPPRGSTTRMVFFSCTTAWVARTGVQTVSPERRASVTAKRPIAPSLCPKRRFEILVSARRIPERAAYRFQKRIYPRSADLQLEK
jgi:hypothetical protein